MSPVRDKWVLLIDSNAPWVRALFSALPGVPEKQRGVLGLRVHTPGFWLSAAKTNRRVKAASTGLTESCVLVPGWTRFQRISTFLLGIRVQRAIGKWGVPEVIVYTFPQYAGVAERFAAHPQVYYAYDPYRFYSGWDSNHIDALEKRMLDATSVAFGISRTLVEDLRKSSHKPVFYSPNAVSAEFIEKLSNGPLPVPQDILDIRSKIVGCIGELDPVAYDWDLIETLSRKFPEVMFVFVGGLSGRAGAARDRACAILHRHNVRWVGRKPHDELPQYLRRFDVCLNPLAATEHNHRRSLLRLYDYLATDKPVLSTALREAVELQKYLQIARNLAELIALLQHMLEDSCCVDLGARREFILGDTWQARAASLWDQIGSTCRIRTDG